MMTQAVLRWSLSTACCEFWTVLSVLALMSLPSLSVRECFNSEKIATQQTQQQRLCDLVHKEWESMLSRTQKLYTVGPQRDSTILHWFNRAVDTDYAVWSL